MEQPKGTSYISGHVQPIAERLHIVTAVFNLDRSRARYAHYHAFSDHMEASGAVLHTIELALGDRAFEVTDPSNPLHIQIRTNQEMWFKENLLNIAARRFDSKYLGFADADFHFTRPDWAYETLHQLQRYPAVQMFESYTTLDADFRRENTMPSYMAAWRQGKRPTADGTGWLGATGGAWAFRRDAFEAIGGLLETEIVGSADWHMMFAVLGIEDPYVKKDMVSAGYRTALTAWAEKAKMLQGRIGCVNNHAIHYWHGPINKRGYETRWQILTKYSFDPETDLTRTPQGLLQFTGNKPEMENEIIAYLEGRGENSDELSPGTSAGPYK